MSLKTAFLNLFKPEAGDRFSITGTEGYNKNMDLIDAAVKKNADGISKLNSDIHVEVFKVTTGSDRFVSFFYGDVDIKKYCDIYGKPISAIIFETQDNSCILTYIHGTYIRVLSLYENLTSSVRVTFKKNE